MNRIKVVVMALVVMIAGALFASGQIVPETKNVSKKVYHKGRHITSRTYHTGKHVTRKTWRKSKHIGRKVGTKTRHVVVGHHHRKP